MAKPRAKTTARRIKETPYGVAERLRDAPPSGYVWNGKRPDNDATYVLDGVEHRFDGACHPACENVR